MTNPEAQRSNSIQEINERPDNNETTPLLSTSISDLDITIAKNDTTESFIQVAKEEFGYITAKSIFTTLTLLMEMSFYTVNMITVGHLGAKALGAMALSITFNIVVATAPIMGLSSTLDTFCSTAFTASRDKTLVGFHYQRGVIAIFTHFVIAAPIMWNAERFLLFIGQDSEIANLSGQYLRIQILNTLPSGLFEATKRYLQAQGIMKPSAIITAVVAPIHWLNCYLLVRSPTFGIGFKGAPLVNSISNSIMLVALLLYIRFSSTVETWGGWKRSAFRNMWAFYSVAIPTVVTVAVDWISFELLSLGASYFGHDQLAASAVVFNTSIILYHFSNGIGIAVGPRIGNLIGDAKPRQARIDAIVGILAAACIVTTSCLALWFLGNKWLPIYTNDPTVIRETLKLLPVVCIVILGDGISCVLSAILRGLGRQKISANVLTVGHYAFSLPAALYLGYVRHMETVGLWWGICVGIFIGITFHAIYIFMFIDWKDEVRICLLRLKDSSRANAENTSSE